MECVSLCMCLYLCPLEVTFSMIASTLVHIVTDKQHRPVSPEPTNKGLQQGKTCSHLPLTRIEPSGETPWDKSLMP